MIPQYTAFEFIGLYNTKSIRSVITGKDTEKCKYMKIITVLNCDIFMYKKQGHLYCFWNTKKVGCPLY